MRSRARVRGVAMVVAWAVMTSLPTAAWGQTTSTTSTSAPTSSTTSSTSTSSTTTASTIVIDPLCFFQGGCLDEPPEAFLAGTGGEQRGVALGYCWQLPGQPPQTACTSVRLQPPSPLAVEEGTDLTLRFAPSLPATELIVVRRPSSDPPSQTVAQQLSLPPGRGGTFGADFPPGTWDLEVTAEFAQGRVPYFFRITVEEDDEAGPATPVVPDRVTFTG